LQGRLGDRILIETAHFPKLVLSAVRNKPVRHAETFHFDAGKTLVGEKFA